MIPMFMSSFACDIINILTNMFLPIISAHVLGAQKKRLVWLRYKKIIFCYARLTKGLYSDFMYTQ